MKKDIYELFNDIDVDVDACEEIRVSELEKEKLKRNLRNEIRKPMNHKWKKALMSIAITMIIVSSTLFGLSFTTFANEIPIIGSIFKFFDQDGNLENYSDNAQNIDLVAEDNGVKISIDEAVFDGNNVFITYTIESEIDLGEEPYLNGEMENKEDNRFLGGSFNTRKIEENKYIGFDIFDFDKWDKNDYQTIDLKWNITSIDLEPNPTSSEKKVEGNWNFEFALDAVDSKVQWVQPTENEYGTLLEVAKEKSLDVRIEKITYTPMSFTIFYEEYYSMSEFAEWDFIDTILEVKDDLGNHYTGGVAGGGYGWDNGKYHVMNYTDTFGKLDPDAQKLIITPVIRFEDADGEDEFGGKYRLINSKAPREEYKLDEIVIEIDK